MAMGGFVKTVEASMIPPGSMLTLDVAGEKVTVANVDGKYHAMGAICTHARWDLAEGVLEDFTITCAGHGTIWDLRTGRGVFDEPLPDEPIYDVMEEGGYLYMKKR